MRGVGAMNRMRSEEGFTLMEVVTALAVGFIIISAIFALVESSVRMNTGVMAKTDAMQRGRQAMDQITQQLRSQVCLDLDMHLLNDEPAIAAGSDSQTVTFYADFTAAGVRPDKRILRFDAAGRAIRSEVRKPTVDNPLPNHYASLTARRNTELENAALQKDEDGKDVPFLRYYAYKIVDGRPVAEELLSTPLTTQNAERVARIDVAFLSLPTGSTDRKRGVNLGDQVMARHSNVNLTVTDPDDPNAEVPAPDPNCV
jgi:type II secretory pathway pseudopilin PulG